MVAEYALPTAIVTIEQYYETAIQSEVTEEQLPLPCYPA